MNYDMFIDQSRDQNEDLICNANQVKVMIENALVKL
jgi:hypothetical protein